MSGDRVPLYFQKNSTKDSLQSLTDQAYRKLKEVRPDLYVAAVEGASAVAIQQQLSSKVAFHIERALILQSLLALEIPIE